MNIEAELTQQQELEILKVFKRHRIAIPSEKEQGLFLDIEIAWESWAVDKECTPRPAGKQEILADIRRLKHAMKTISPGALETLCWSKQHSDAEKQLERTGLYRRLIESLVNNFGIDDDKHIYGDIFDLSWSMIHDACEEVLKTGGTIFDGETAVDHFATKRGRPKKRYDVSFIYKLGHTYRRATGKRPTETPHGPFEDFVACVFKIIQPRKERLNFRKLIHAALSK